MKELRIFVHGTLGKEAQLLAAQAVLNKHTAPVLVQPYTVRGLAV